MEDKQHNGQSDHRSRSGGSGGHTHSGSGHHHHHHHHHRRLSLSQRIKRFFKRRRLAGVSMAIVGLAVAAAILVLHNHSVKQNRYEVVSKNEYSVGKGYREVEYQGKTYRYNNRVTTILYAGVDADGPIEETVKYTMAPCADSISLVVMDELHQKTTIIALNRDTMTPIHKYTLNGRERGLYVDHLSMAFNTGNGGKVSCDNLCQAISDLLFGIPINGYVISSRASIPNIADAIGPVEVVVPNNDLYYRGFSAGETVVIDGSNLETFVRYRDTGIDNSNSGRMARQQAYIEGAMDKLVSLLTKNPSSAWETLEKAEDCVRTDITRSRYLDLTKVLKHTGYTQGNYYIPEGEQVVGYKYDEFYPDMEQLKAKVIELFYIEK